jgi:bifunctional DNase/RNase
VTTIRIAHAEPRPGRLANGGFHTRGHLVVLVDDAGHRAVPIWIQGAGDLANLLKRPADQVITDGVPQELTTRLLGAARARVTGVDIDVTEAGVTELSPEVTVARIGLATPAGPEHVTARLLDGLAMAVMSGAPIRVADAVMDRLAVPAGASQDGPMPEQTARDLSTGLRPRYEPRSLTFAVGLDHWALGGSFTESTLQSRWQDYSAAADHGTAVLSAAVPEPEGFAWLAQEIFADDYRGTTVTFRGHFRGPGSTGRAGLFLRVMKSPAIHGPFTTQAALADPGNRVVTIANHADWTAYEVTASIPDDTDTLAFGVFLTGPGRIELRDPELTPAGPA